MIRIHSSLWCLSRRRRQVGIVADHRPITKLVNCWGSGVMALLNKDPFSSSLAGFHGFSNQVGSSPATYEQLRATARFPPLNIDVVGNGTDSPTSSNGINNSGNWLSLKGCSDRSASDGHGQIRRRVDDRFQKPSRALAPLPYPQLLHYYSDARLEEERDSTTRPMMNGSKTFQRKSPLGFLDRPLPDKLVVAVDVDEVLGSFVSALNKFIADRYALNHSVSEYHVYEFFKIWNCSRNEGATRKYAFFTPDIRVHEFFKTTYFKTGIHPIPGAQVALHKLSTFCNLSVVTSRQNAIKDHTIEWIEKHYPGLFQEIHFGNHFALDGKSRPKSEICRSLGAHVLIDDNPRYAMECAEVGIRVLLFDYENSYPWCKADSATLHHPLVTKVHSWKEVEQQLASWVMS